MPTCTATKIVVLSDIHISDDSPTSWFQSSVHDPFLESITTWVEAQTDLLERVLLGDVVDF